MYLLLQAGDNELSVSHCPVVVSSSLCIRNDYFQHFRSHLQRQRQLRNGRTATEWWKPGV